MKNKPRQVVVYKDYFQVFFAKQDRKVQDKIIKILDIIEQLDRIPESYLKYIVETDGLYEILNNQVGYNDPTDISEIKTNAAYSDPTKIKEE